jgi:hypothetical protein
MRALIPNCTLEESPADSNTQKPADVVGPELREHGVDVDSVRVADLRVEPGVHEKPLTSEILGPGPGPDYSGTDHGHEWPEKTAATMASNLLAVATALAKQPIPA